MPIHFWRALEHRLQMEHGLQTQSLLPLSASAGLLAARRMNFFGDNALADFEAVVASTRGLLTKRLIACSIRKIPGGPAAGDPELWRRLWRILMQRRRGLAASLVLNRLTNPHPEKLDVAALASRLQATADASLNATARFHSPRVAVLSTRQRTGDY